MAKKNTAACLIVLAAVGCFTACKTGATDAEQLYVQAVAKYAANDLSGAEILVTEALKHEKSFYQAELLQGKIRFFEGDNLGALKTFSALTKRMPQYTDARIWKIRTLILLDKYTEAEKALDTEISVNAGDWRVYYQYALLANAAGNTEKRINMLKTAELHFSESARVYIDLAKVWHSLRMEDRALDYLERATTVAGTGGGALAGTTGSSIAALKTQIRVGANDAK